MDDNKKKIQVTDRRFWVVDRDAVEKAPEARPQYPSFVAELKARTEKAEFRLGEKLEELKSENNAFRQRLTRETERRLQEAKVRLFAEFLEVIDNFERALQAPQTGNDSEMLREGVALNLELFQSRLRGQGLETINLLGSEFDPATAEAIGTVEVTDPGDDQKVVEVLQPGYHLGETLVRAAVVKVGRYKG